MASTIPHALKVANTAGLPRTLRLQLIGHLTEDSLTAALEPVITELQHLTGRGGLIVECLTMTGYDAAARSLFVSWNKLNRDRFNGIAILTKNRLWHMVISSMSLASGQKMKAFASVEEANVWLARLARSTANDDG